MNITAKMSFEKDLVELTFDTGEADSVPVHMEVSKKEFIDLVSGKEPWPAMKT